MANEKEISKRMNKLITSDKTSNFIKRRMALGDRGAFNLVKSRAAKAARATKVGKIAAGVAAAALATKAGLEKLYEKRTGKKPFTKREKKRTLVDKKMGGGMMKKPMGYDKGGMPIGKAVGKAFKKVAKSKFARRASIPFMGLTALGKAGEFLDKKIKAKKKMGGGLTEATRRLRAQGLKNGGMCRGMGAAIRGGDFKGVK